MENNQPERFYSRVDGARYVFRDGHDCYFPQHYYETQDRQEIEELTALCRSNNNPLVFRAKPGEEPQFGNEPRAFVIQGQGRSAAEDADAMFALSLAVAKAQETGQPLVYDSLPDVVKAGGNAAAMLEKMNQLLTLKVNTDQVPMTTPDGTVIPATPQPPGSMAESPEPAPDALAAAQQAMASFSVAAPADKVESQ